MIVKNKYKIWHAINRRDDTNARNSLQHVLVCKAENLNDYIHKGDVDIRRFVQIQQRSHAEALAMATNGFLLVVIPIPEWHEADMEGLVHWTIFQSIMKAKKTGHATIPLGNVMVNGTPYVLVGDNLFRRHRGIDESDTWPSGATSVIPKFDKIIPTGVLSFDGQLIEKACKANGAPRSQDGFHRLFDLGTAS